QDEVAADALGKRLHAFAQRVPLEGEGKLGAMRMHELGNPPGERALVGHSHDEASLPRHQARAFRHPHTTPTLRNRGPHPTRCLRRAESAHEAAGNSLASCSALESGGGDDSRLDAVIGIMMRSSHALPALAAARSALGTAAAFTHYSIRRFVADGCLTGA